MLSVGFITSKVWDMDAIQNYGLYTWREKIHWTPEIWIHHVESMEHGCNPKLWNIHLKETDSLDARIYCGRISQSYAMT
jgi:hypothetical protein